MLHSIGFTLAAVSRLFFTVRDASVSFSHRFVTEYHITKKDSIQKVNLFVTASNGVRKFVQLKITAYRRYMRSFYYL